MSYDNMQIQSTVLRVLESQLSRFQNFLTWFLGALFFIEKFPCKQVPPPPPQPPPSRSLLPTPLAMAFKLIHGLGYGFQLIQNID